jgi:glycosyltransferase involved in cell wall biosynthesis
LAVKKSDLICTVSNYSKEMLQKHYHIPDSKLHITPNSTFLKDNVKSCTDIKSKYGLSDFILFVSRIEPRKNHLLLLKAFNELKLYEENYSLVFIGSHAIKYLEFNEYYLKLKPAVKNKIIFLDHLNDAELACFYKEASLFVFPSLAEGFGIPPLEAALNDTKVLCSNATAMKEFDFFEKYNLTFNPNNLDELKVKIRNVLKDDFYPFNKIKVEINSKYNWDLIAANFIKKIHEII